MNVPPEDSIFISPLLRFLSTLFSALNSDSTLQHTEATSVILQLIQFLLLLLFVMDRRFVECGKCMLHGLHLTSCKHLEYWNRDDIGDWKNA